MGRKFRKIIGRSHDINVVTLEEIEAFEKRKQRRNNEAAAREKGKDDERKKPAS